MSTPPFDGSEYRRSVLAPLRDGDPATVEDLFWLAHVPRDADDDAAVRARLRETKGFLNKERSRARQAAVASAVLKQWPRVEQVLGDPAARRALRERLAATPTAGPPAPAGPPRRRAPAVRGADPAARRRRQTAEVLRELARLRGEPELGTDLFAFLGLSPAAPRELVEQRIERVGEVNRRRRPDRERTVVDLLLSHARELLLRGDPGAYLAGFTDDARDAVVDALMAGDAAGAVQALGAARAQGVGDGAVLGQVARAARGSASVVPVSATGLGTWCPACGTVNGPGAVACSSCASGLTVRCPACGAEAAADAVACPNGHALDAAREALREARRDAEAATAPPAPPAQVTAAPARGEVELAWAPSEGAEAYLVERVEAGRRRVLGRTSLTSWTDAAPTGPEVTWEVRALRGDAASAPARAGAPAAPASRPPESVMEEPAPPAPPSDDGRVHDVVARNGIPVELSWRAPAGARVRITRVERRPEGDVVRPIVADADGYVDRHVGPGRRYEYRVALEGSDTPPATVVVRTARGGAAARRAGAAQATRTGDGRVVVIWPWPPGVTEAYVAWAPTPPEDPDASTGRKVTNMRYDLEGGAVLDGVPPGAHLAIFPGRRGSDGTLRWQPATARTVAP